MHLVGSNIQRGEVVLRILGEPDRHVLELKGRRYWKLPSRMRIPAPLCLNYYPWQKAGERLHIESLLQRCRYRSSMELQGWLRAWIREASSAVQCGEQCRLGCAALTIALSASDSQNTKLQLNRKALCWEMAWRSCCGMPHAVLRKNTSGVASLLCV